MSNHNNNVQLRDVSFDGSRDVSIDHVEKAFD